MQWFLVIVRVIEIWEVVIFIRVIKSRDVIISISDWEDSVGSGDRSRVCD